MIDFEEARIKMVDCQVRTCDVTDHDIISAMMSVPREEFVPEGLRELAYIDDDISLSKLDAEGRFLMEPAPFAKLLQLAAVREDDIVLVIGCGSGYSAAVLSLLGASVVAIEQDKALADYASSALAKLGFDNAVVLNAPHNNGYAKEAPFDIIFMDGAVSFVPEILLDQLSEGGRLVAVQGEGNSAVAQVHANSDGILNTRSAINLSIKPLPGFATKAGFTF